MAEKSPKEGTKIKRWVSAAVLAAAAVVLAILFFRLVQPLAVPLFFAAVVAMLVAVSHLSADSRVAVLPRMARSGRCDSMQHRGHRRAACGDYLPWVCQAA